MRQIMLDTETTGLEWRNGDRIVEIGCVEMVSRKLTGRHYHVYINPEREVDAGAMAVHGITNEFLVDKPKFAAIVEEFEAFVEGAELVIHNAPFDVGFLNMELDRLGRPRLDQRCSGVIDTLKMAKEQNPGKKASLDALCSRFEIDNAHRTLHGALLDAELLGEVYLAMTRGQESLIMDLDDSMPGGAAGEEGGGLGQRAPIRIVRATEDELVGHQRVLGEILKASKGKCLWQEPTPESAPEAQS